MVGFGRGLRGILAAALLVACSCAEEGLFETGAADEADKASNVTRQRLARIDEAYFTEHVTEREGGGAGKPFSLRLNLFDDFAVDLELIERPAGESAAKRILGGEAPAYEHSMATFTITDGRISGNLRLDGRLFRIRPTEDGLHRIEEVAPPQIREHEN